MSIRLSIERGPVYFISDCHLGAGTDTEERERRLIDLLRQVRGHAGGLFVLGDLFDFWFEYRHAIPKGTFRIARALAEVVDSGVPTVYLGGNHDFWIGSYLQKEVGLTTFLEPITVRLHGRIVLLAHGDGLGPGDNGYKILKAILRHPLAIAGYRSIHPDLGIPLGWNVSAMSRNHTKDREVLLPKILRDVARPALRGEVEAMVMGHVHEPSHFRSNGREFLLVGDWIKSFTHVRLEEGHFTLYRRDGHGEFAVAVEPFPRGLEPEPFSRIV